LPCKKNSNVIKKLVELKSYYLALLLQCLYNKDGEYGMDLKVIREIAKRYSPEQIEGCITEQMKTGMNVCLTDEGSEKIINELSKAEVVRDLMDHGMSLADALRELARRMRLIQEGVQKAG
jgi:hypothetical protein